MKSYDRLFIGGEWVEPSSSSVIDVVSPTTEELVGRVPEAQNADIDRAVAAARDAFDHGPWPRMTPVERAEILTKVANAIRENTEDLTTLISNETGSPVSWAAMAQVFAPTMILDYYAGLGSTYPFEQMKDGLLGPVIIAKEPVGVVAAITPWNVPLFLACAKLAPALLSGSTVVFKPAPETPLDAFVLAEMLADAGLPKGVLSVVPAGREVGDYLVHRSDIDKVSFTGSTAAGRKIATACGENLTRFSLELGGKSAAVLLDDVNLEEALPLMMPNAIMNNGEACISLTRILAPTGPLRRDDRRARRAGEAAQGRGRARSRDRRRTAGRGASSATGSRGTSTSVRRRVPRSPWAAGGPKPSTRGGSSSRPSSWTSTTRCASHRRRSSDRCSR